MKKLAYIERRIANENIQGLETWNWKANEIQKNIRKIPNWDLDNSQTLDDFKDIVEVISKWKDVNSGNMDSSHGVTQYWDVIKKLESKYL